MYVDLNNLTTIVHHNQLEKLIINIYRMVRILLLKNIILNRNIYGKDEIIEEEK